MVCFDRIYSLKLILNLICCGLSCAFSLLVIFVIFKKSLFKTYSFKILTYISLNDFLRSLIGLFESLIVDNNPSCLIYGFFDNYFFLSNMVLSLCLTCTIYQIVVLENFSFEKYHKHWVLFSFVAVGFILSFPFITNSYGKSSGLCQINIDKVGNIWRIIIIYTTSLSMLFAIIIISVKIYKKIKLLGTISFISIVFERGLVYTFIISLVLIPFFVIRVLQIFTDDCNIQSYVTIAYIFYNLQGFLNAIVFFSNKTIRSLLKKSEESPDDIFKSINSLWISFRSDININN